jgi:lipopolysaccharide transport system permease protein
VSITTVEVAVPDAEVPPVATVAGAPEDVLVNDARPVSARRFVADLWACRGLILVLARKDFFVRYRRSLLGLVWVLLVPLVQAFVLTVVFSRMARFSAGQDHYPVYVFSGFMVWVFFSSSLMAGSTSIVDGKDLAGRIYFPRAVLPITKLVTDLFTMATSIGILLVLCAGFGVHLGMATLLLLPSALLLVALTMGFTLLLSGLHVHFRDVRFIVTAIVLPWFYVTPVFYSPQQLSGTLRRVVSVNPITGVLDAFRAATVGAPADWRLSVSISCGLAAVLLLAGVQLQRRLDRNLLDKL